MAMLLRYDNENSLSGERVYAKKVSGVKLNLPGGSLIFVGVSLSIFILLDKTSLAGDSTVSSHQCLVRYPFEVRSRGEYLPLPADFGCCRYAMLQCCGLKEEFAFRFNESPLKKSINSSLFMLTFPWFRIMNLFMLKKRERGMEENG
jgi:hypothetical protein